MSLKVRLTAFSTVLVLFTLALISVISYHYVADAFSRQLDDAIDERAAEVLDDAGRMGPAFFTTVPPSISGSNRAQLVPVYVQVVDHLGTIRYTSALRGQEELPVDRALLHEALKGAQITTDAQSAAGTSLHVRYMALTGGDKSQPAVLQVATPLGPTESTLDLMRLLLLSTTLVSSALVGLGVWVTASRTLGAVDRVTRTARRIELSQDLSARIPAAESAGDDEMGRLVRTFNSMLDRISVAFDAQRQFVADSSHELRSPLTVIRGNLDLLRRTPDPGERAAIARLIEDEAARMSRLVDNLLYLAQLEENEGDGGPALRRLVELDSLLLTVYQQARSMTDRHLIQLGEEDAITIEGDRDQLQQLLLNLVDNAIKYTPAGGIIVLSLSSEGDFAVLQVRDTGMGIPRHDLPHIFDRFYRVDRARSRRYGGAGLGLSIVQRIAASHGGTVAVESAPGKGSVFQVRLPRIVPQTLAPVTAATATPATVSNVVSAGRGPH